jgi:hypothetical protein
MLCCCVSLVSLSQYVRKVQQLPEEDLFTAVTHCQC